MSVDFATFRKLAPFVIDVRKPVLLRGRHGVGKSQVVYQIAEDLELRVVERRASQMTEGDLVGLPSISGNSTTFNPPDWFKEACGEPVCLFLDEVDRATPEVRQGIFELTDSRKLNGHHLHPDTIVFAAINGGEHGAMYQVGDMDPAELDRWTVFDVEPSVEDWLTWGRGTRKSGRWNIDPVTWDFINQNRTHLEHEEDFEPNKVYPSRRSWDRLNKCLVKAELLTEKGAAENLLTIYELTMAFCGQEAAVAFRDFVENYKRQVSISDILDDGDLSKVEDFGINDHSAFIEKLEASGRLNEELTDDAAQNLALYFVSLPSEVAMKLWAVLGQGYTQNTRKIHQCEVGQNEDGSPVKLSKFLVKILKRDKKDQ